MNKNLLRFAKGRGFKEISLKSAELGIEDTYSSFFLERLGQQLLKT
jgi:hypothetical protein